MGNGEQVNNGVQLLTVLFGSSYALAFEQWISLIVVLTGVVTMLINWHYKHKELRLKERQLKTNEENDHE